MNDSLKLKELIVLASHKYNWLSELYLLVANSRLNYKGSDKLLSHRSRFYRAKKLMGIQREFSIDVREKYIGFIEEFKQYGDDQMYRVDRCVFKFSDVSIDKVIDALIDELDTIDASELYTLITSSGLSVERDVRDVQDLYYVSIKSNPLPHMEHAKYVNMILGVIFSQPLKPKRRLAYVEKHPILEFTNHELEDTKLAIWGVTDNFQTYCVKVHQARLFSYWILMELMTYNRGN